MIDATHDAASPATHHWKFFRAGGFDQVRLDTAEDLFALKDLDPKLWVALSCPVGNIDFAPETLALLDVDADGHIRAADLLACIEWCRERLGDKTLLVRGATKLPLSAFDTAGDAGQRLLRSARQILQNLGRADDVCITLDDVADLTAIFGQTRFNGDGIVTARSAADDAAAREALAAVGEACGTMIDRSGEAGVDAAAITTYFDGARAYLAWQDAQPACPADFDPLGAATAFAVIRDKVDDFFTRCRLAAYDPRASVFMNGSDAELDVVGRGSLAVVPAALAALPLARVEAAADLPLEDGVNPAWQGAADDFRRLAVRPLLGATAALPEAVWLDLKAQLAALADWFAARPPAPAAAPEAWTAWLADGVEGRLLKLVEQDLAVAEEAAGIDEVRKLLLLVRDLAAFANNFVSFRDFYTRKGRSMFQCGTLYMDGRSCDLVVPVADIAQHGGLATLARLYLVYCTCRRGNATRHIAAALTDGGADQLMVGRNGVFIDRDGKDWDAQIVRLVEHPISLRQAFWAPYQRIGRMVGEQLQKLAANRAQAAEQKAAQALVDAVARKPGAGPAAAAVAPAAPAAPVAPVAPVAPPPFDVAKFAGIFAAVGLAVGAIGTALAAVITGFLGLSWWQMPLAVLGFLALFSGPSLVIAWFKLRSRTLGPLLDANGWAINARAAINLPFGRSLTHLAKLPAGAERSLTDPYAEKKTPWPVYATLAVVLAAALWFLVRFAVKK